MKIYTSTGDAGTTSLSDGQRVSKTDLRIETYGTVDELNSHLGVAAAARPHADVAEQIALLQSELFVLGSDLASPPGESTRAVPRIDHAAIARLEAGIDTMTASLPPLRNFVLPGGTPAAAHLHVARAVCRRAERLATQLAATTKINPPVLTYLNRLSDFLFTLARWENQLNDRPDLPWTRPPN